MDLNTITHVMIFGLPAILIWLAVSARNIYEIILISNVRTYKIYDLTNKGRVNIIGKAEGSMITSPIANTSCLYWQIEVKELVTTDEQNGRGVIKRTNWTTTFIGSSGDDFYINDGTGRLCLRPPLTGIAIADHRSYENPEERVYGILKDLGVKTLNSIGFEKSLQVVERYITAGKELFIRGIVQEYQGVKILAGNFINPMMISDQDEKVISGRLYRQVVKKTGIVFVAGVAAAFLLDGVL